MHLRILRGLLQHEQLLLGHMAAVPSAHGDLGQLWTHAV